MHLVWLVGFRNRMLVLVNWAWNYLTYEREVRLIRGRRQGARILTVFASRSMRILIGLFAMAVLLAVVLGASCGGGGDDSPQVVLRPEGRPEVRVRVELARTSEERARGLMFREQLDADAGMLFLYDHEEQLVFWMRNTLIPLDMIFISADHRVVGVVENAEPQTDTRRQVGQPSQFVLEVNGGFAAAHGITAGTPVEFRNIE